MHGMKKLSILLSSVFILLTLFACEKKEEVYFESMNTFMKVQAYGKNAEQANEAAQKYIGELEKLISVTKPESDIYKLNHSETFPVEINDQTLALIKFALDISEKSDGAFNPCLYPVSSAWGFTKKQYRVPPEDEIKTKLALCDWKKVKIQGSNVYMENGMQFDLGGIGKGFAGDEAAKKMKEFGIKSALLDLGGNIQLIGKKPDGSKWTVGIKNPIDKDVLGTLKAANVGVITSAGYERFFEAPDGHKYIHIFDGTTGRPVENDLLSTTAIAESGTYCDALSTTLYVLGKDKAIDFWKKYKDFDFILVTDKKEIYVSKGIYKNFTLSPDHADFSVICVE